MIYKVLPAALSRFTKRSARRTRRRLKGLFRDQQTLSERPLMVNPLCVTAKTSLPGGFDDSLSGVLVAALSPDGFVLQKFDQQLGGRYAHRLPAAGAQMHFDAARFEIDTRGVL